MEIQQPAIHLACHEDTRYGCGGVFGEKNPYQTVDFRQAPDLSHNCNNTYVYIEVNIFILTFLSHTQDINASSQL